MDHSPSATAAAVLALISAVQATSAGDLRRELVSDPCAPSANTAERIVSDAVDLALYLHHAGADLSGPLSGARTAIEAMDEGALDELSWLLTDIRNRSHLLLTIVDAARDRYRSGSVAQR